LERHAPVSRARSAAASTRSVEYSRPAG
jgi:hypothetical protein